MQRPADKQRFGRDNAEVRSSRQCTPFPHRDRVRRRTATVERFSSPVANSQHCGGVLTVDDASIDDSWLDLYSIEIESASSSSPLPGQCSRGNASGPAAYGPTARGRLSTSRQPGSPPTENPPARPGNFEIAHKPFARLRSLRVCRNENIRRRDAYINPEDIDREEQQE